MEHKKVRVRFAPSPTGPLHLGGVRTALYNYLFAKKNHGDFILRIEDTDRNRYVPGAEEYILKALDWCGLHFDEDVLKGGPCAPYRQSERSSLYRNYAFDLVNRGYAYYAFDTAEDLEAARLSSPGGPESFQYGSRTRKYLKNSLTLAVEEVKGLLSSGIKFVIRILINPSETIIFQDRVRGEVRVQTDTLDDKVLFKSDGLPTYHLANVVDDYLMGITHVIRGEEWLPSAPMHLLLYKFFGWEDSMPEFVHLPLILKPEGNGKLSKRDGDRLGFPVFPLQWQDPSTGEISSGYRETGYLPEAFINMLALLGWHPENEQEIFSLSELIDLFSFERIVRSGAKFDPAKAKWFNHKYIQRKSPGELFDFLEPLLSVNHIETSRDHAEKVISLVRDRVDVIPDLWKNSWYFFTPPQSYDQQMLKKIWQEETPGLLTSFISELEASPSFDLQNLQILIRNFLSGKNIKMPQLMNPVRLLIVGSSQGPGVLDIALLLGKDEFIERIKRGLNNI